MTEVRFYHLQRKTLEDALPQILEKTLERGWRAVVMAGSEERVEALIPKDRNVVIYCRSGNRSVFAADTLQEMGYANVASMAGGIGAWVDAGGEVE